MMELPGDVHTHIWLPEHLSDEFRHDLAQVALILQIQGIEFDGAAKMGEGFRVHRSVSIPF